MSTLVGHALAGTLATVAGADRIPNRRALTGLAIATALLPDLDIVVFLLLRPAGMAPHRGASHTVLFALVASAVLALLAARPLRAPPWRLWGVLVLAALSHPVLDYLMGAGPPVPFLAPLTERGWLFPVRLLPIAYYGKTAAAYLQPGFWLLNLMAAAIEVAIFMPLVVVVLARPRPRTRLLALAVCACALAVSLQVYGHLPA